MDLELSWPFRFSPPRLVVCTRCELTRLLSSPRLRAVVLWLASAVHIACDALASPCPMT